MTTHPFSKKRSQLRKLLYAAAAVILLGSLLASYMHWEANHLEFNENTAPAGCVPGLSGLRILVLSDIHTNLPLLEKAATMAEQAQTGHDRVSGRSVHGFSAGHSCRRLHRPDETPLLRRPAYSMSGQP